MGGVVIASWRSDCPTLLTTLRADRIVRSSGIGLFMRRSLAIALSALTICGFACGAAAEEYCVTCTEPDAKYRCVIAQPHPDAHDEHGPLRCISEIAQRGSHASCSVGAATSGPCATNLQTVTLPAEAPAQPVPAPAPVYTPVPGPETAVPAKAEAEPAPQPEAPPKTVEEFAKKTAKASGDGLKKAGDAVTDGAQSAGNAVGKAAKKTWDCLSSFFGNC
jgi:hypothetical protein